MAERYLALRFGVRDESDESRLAASEVLHELKVSGISELRRVASSRGQVVVVIAVPEESWNAAATRTTASLMSIIQRNGVEVTETGVSEVLSYDAAEAVFLATLSPELHLFLDPGDAPPEVVARVLEALSNLHRAAGGTGLTFRSDGELVIPLIAAVG